MKNTTDMTVVTTFLCFIPRVASPMKYEMMQPMTIGRRGSESVTIASEMYPVTLPPSSTR